MRKKFNKCPVGILPGPSDSTLDILMTVLSTHETLYVMRAQVDLAYMY